MNEPRSGWTADSGSGGLSQQLLCSQQPNESSLSAHALAVLRRLSRPFNNGVIPHTESLWSAEDARRSDSSSYSPPQGAGKDAGGQRCCERTLTMRASPGSALFVRRKRRPLVTRGNTHRSTAMRHQTVGTRLSGDSAFNVPLFKRKDEQKEGKDFFWHENDCRLINVFIAL